MGEEPDIDVEIVPASREGRAEGRPNSSIFASSRSMKDLALGIISP